MAAAGAPGQLFDNWSPERLFLLFLAMASVGGALAFRRNAPRWSVVAGAALLLAAGALALAVRIPIGRTPLPVREGKVPPERW